MEQAGTAAASKAMAKAAAPKDGKKDGDAKKKKKEEDVRKQPVLPWMRVPITIDPGSGVPLENLKDIDPRIIDAVKNSKAFTII